MALDLRANRHTATDASPSSLTRTMPFEAAALPTAVALVYARVLSAKGRLKPDAALAFARLCGHIASAATMSMATTSSVVGGVRTCRTSTILPSIAECTLAIA